MTFGFPLSSDFTRRCAFVSESQQAISKCDDADSLTYQLVKCNECPEAQARDSKKNDTEKNTPHPLITVRSLDGSQNESPRSQRGHELGVMRAS